MAVIPWLMGLALLAQGCLCSLEQADVGCKTWAQKGDDACCQECHDGNHLVRECGSNPKQLCKLCEPGFYTQKPMDYGCTICTQCVGAQVTLEACTAKTDTKCGCKKGLICGDESCSFCVEKCGKGYELINRTCKPCPGGTFRDESNEKCKPWSTKCPNPNQEIVTQGNASSDIQCVTLVPVIHPKRSDHSEDGHGALIMITGAALMAFCTITITVIVALKTRQKKKEEKPAPPKPIIRTPTDDPRTLIAIECSFHEAQQEQGSSTESLISKETIGQLIV
ncbi:tumor necrosis factor receptor superfamily member 9a isoform 1-T2 [Odontesthes bonariensis]|uniref:tumor necrosis factor receptor superfamily member 9a n=1 Tax=Odontesthes bonariensis TaxID=219752 RepID=UPI003F58C680